MECEKRVKQRGCQYGKCQRSGTLLCAGCRKVHYCSEKCRTDDWCVHQAVCHQELSKRLRGLLLFLLPLQGDADIINLSRCMWDTVMNGNHHNISAFGPWGILNRCVFCSVLITSVSHDQYSELYDPYAECHGLFERRVVKYYRCVDCGIAEKLLCSHQFVDTAQCCATNHCKQVLLLHALSPVLITDVVHYIAALFSSLCCCQ